MKPTKPPIFQYICDPQTIYERSFASIREQVDLSSFPEDTQSIIVRMIHSCGIPEIAPHIAYHKQLATAAKTALAQQVPVLVDSNMLKAAILKDARFTNPIICTLDLPTVQATASQKKTTRSAAAVDLWKNHIHNAIVVIGNAPTALFRLLECLLCHNFPMPSAIIACPVGFVGALESKEALIEHAPVPFITVRGMIGGTAIAAGAINALIYQTLQLPPHE